MDESSCANYVGFVWVLCFLVEMYLCWDFLSKVDSVKLVSGFI